MSMRDISAIRVAQAMDFLHVAVALVGEPPKMVEMRALFHVVRLIGVRDTQCDVAEIAQTEGSVCFFDGKLDELAP